jgi:hypothetical protein
LNIYHCRSIQDLVRNRIVFVAQSQVQRQIRGRFEFVLKITLEEGSAISHHTLALQVGGRISLVVNEIVSGGIHVAECSGTVALGVEPKQEVGPTEKLQERSEAHDIDVILQPGD